MGNKQARIIGTGQYLPDKILSNKGLEKIIETSDEWIVTRTGVKERRIASEDETCSMMATEAAKEALAASGKSVDEIDVILTATVTPDYQMPCTANLVQKNLKARKAYSLDIHAACSGFIYGIKIASALIESGQAKNILLIASEKLSSKINYQDRTTCILFGDGATAAVLSSEGKGLLVENTVLGSDGEQSDLLIIPGGGVKTPLTEENITQGLQYVQMKGNEVFKHAVRRMETVALEVIRKSGLIKEQIDWFIPHQANIRIIDTIAKRLDFQDSKVFKTLHKYGNTSASSIGIALNELLEKHPPQEGQYFLLVAFGAGLTYGASLLKAVE